MSISVYGGGSVVYARYVLGQEKPVSREVIASDRAIAEKLLQILDARKDDIAKIPEELVNHSCDGSRDEFRFGSKKIGGYNIHGANIDIEEELKTHPFRYELRKGEMERLKEIFFENLVLDIYDEIKKILEEFNLGIELPTFR